MRIHSVVSSQLNKARAVAILTPHLTARAACVFEPFFYVVICKRRVLLPVFPEETPQPFCVPFNPT
jgi:hypothetical protein